MKHTILHMWMLFSVGCFYGFPLESEETDTLISTENSNIDGGSDTSDQGTEDISTEKDITRFTIKGIDGVIGTNTIKLRVPDSTDLEALVPTIVHTGAIVSPPSGVKNDFTNPVKYTVTAEDGSQKEYTVTVSVVLEGTIVAFNSNTEWTVPSGIANVEVLVVAGGGGGGTYYGAGGGAGGVVYDARYPVKPGANISVTVGSGGAGGHYPLSGSNGAKSSFGSLTAVGGGGGGSWDIDVSNEPWKGRNGGSGGGGVNNAGGGFGTFGQGNAGGDGATTGSWGGGGGGGKNSAGGNGAPNAGGIGGQGQDYSAVFGVEYGANGVFGGGGGGSLEAGAGAPGAGGSGGGGRGAKGGQSVSVAGTPNTGGGGGGGCSDKEDAGASGGSGIVIVKY
ncbi:MAG: DUF5018 domain-containing protein [Myxococcota bacterium]|jgi:hypothetical protein|nr:DUF5018 domain-containing protein [Myxococcota bacterium]